MTKEERLAALKRIYRLRQLQGIIPFSMSFEEYVKFMSEFYKI